MPANDSDPDESPNDDLIPAPPRMMASGDNQKRLVTNSGGIPESATPRKRLIVMSFFMLATIALILLVSTCFVSPGEWSVREMEERSLVVAAQLPLKTVVDGSKQVQGIRQASTLQSSDRAEKQAGDSADMLDAQPRSAPGARQTAAILRPADKAKTDATPNAPGAGITGGKQNLVPIVVVAVRRSPPVASVNLSGDVAPRDLQLEATLSDSSQAVTFDISSQLDRDEGSTETRVPQDRQETILISFPFDSDDFGLDSHLALDRAASILRGDTSNTASIIGFTDNKGDMQYNLVLSRKRANAVERYLVNAGVARDRLRVEGRGVLTDPVEVQLAGGQDAAEPYRIVQIKLGRDG